MRLWTITNGGLGLLSVLDAHQEPARAVAFGPSRTLLAAAGLDGLVLLWEISDR